MSVLRLQALTPRVSSARPAVLSTTSSSGTCCNKSTQPVKS